MKIEIWSDFVCPFCYIGKRKLERAIGQISFQGDIDIVYKSHQLDPDAKHIPGKSFYETFSDLKGVPLDQVKLMNKQVAEQAEKFNLMYRFDTMKYANTFDAHRIAKYAAAQGKGKEMTERLLHAYFTESKLISDPDTLLELSDEVGLRKGEIKEVLETNQFAEDVREEMNEAYQVGVKGVPFFIFNRKYAISGAQPDHVFLQTLEKVQEEEA